MIRSFVTASLFTVTASLAVGCASDDGVNFLFDAGTGRGDTGGASDTGFVRDIGVQDTGGSDDTGGEDVTAPDTVDDTTDVALDGADAGDVEEGDAVADAGDASADVADAADVAPDVVPDVVEDIVEDVPRPEGCGDGRVEGDEECDDGNDIDTDECTNACRVATCGDGIVNITFGEERFESPTVTNPFGATGYVCDDGATCPGSECDVSDDGNAPEHGICQALDFERAVTVSYGDGLGGGTTPAPRPVNWFCFDFRCWESEFEDASGACEDYEMLTWIDCEGLVGEECDDGAGNADEADACRTDCTLPTCGDGIVDSDEECDDANYDDFDACLTDCVESRCGDGIVHEILGEACDDGNDVDDDTCTNGCAFGPAYVPCGDQNVPMASGSFSGSTAGAGNDFTDYSSQDYAYSFTATRNSRVTASLCGGATWDTRLVAYDATDACAGPQLVQNDDACGLQSTINFDVVAGRSYVVVVEAFSSGSGPYTLTLTMP